MSHALSSAAVQPALMRGIHHVHFVGIGGAGMGGIAEVLLNLGFSVSGSDVNRSSMTQRLTELGACCYQGHHADFIGAADVVVMSSAVAEDNIELRAAREARIPVVPRAEMLAELMRFRKGIAVAGTHGKTTTTSLVASILAHAGLDPTFVIGGRLKSASANAKLGSGEYLVAEADESDASFLHLQPVFAIVTNIDADHLSAYDGDFERLKAAFLEFLHHLPFYGLAVMCADDSVIRSVLPQVTRQVITYGIEQPADVRAVQLSTDGPRSCFSVALGEQIVLPNISLNLPGQHNVLNALAAVAIALELGVAHSAIHQALDQFAGIGRRLEILGERELAGHRVLMLDDYGHHPREIAATINAVRASWPQRRVVVVFQPHRYSRTRELFEDFVQQLIAADQLLITEVYSAGEAPLAGADARSLIRAIRARGVLEPIFIPDLNQLQTMLASVLQTGDVLLTLGAGNIGAVAARIAHEAKS